MFSVSASEDNCAGARSRNARLVPCGVVSAANYTAVSRATSIQVTAAFEWLQLNFEPVFCSEGTIENNPAFQCWERFGKIESRRDG
jgi:hypothetical protein